MNSGRAIALAMRRSLRTSFWVTGVVLVAFVDVGIASFRASGGAAGMRSLQALLTNPAMQALYGRSIPLTTGGALVSWKMGSFLGAAVMVWGALMATRLTRGAEDAGTWEYYAVGPQPRLAALGWAVGELALSGVAFGASLAVTMLSNGERVSSSVLFGATITGATWCGAAVGLVAAQLVRPRRASSQLAMLAIGTFFVLRMLADGATALRWLDGATPFGWSERVGAFDVHHAGWLGAYGALAVGAVGCSGLLARRRDVGAATFARRDQSGPTTLHGPGALWWRERRGLLAGWTVGVALFELVIGYLTHAMVSFYRADPSFAHLLVRWGYGASGTANGFLAEVGTLLSVGTGLFVAALLGSVAHEVGRGWLDVALATGLSRVRYLATAATLILGALCVVSIVGALGLWVGATASGDTVSLSSALWANLNGAAPALCFAGLGLLVLARWPGATFVAVSVVVAASYLDAALGSALGWSRALLDLSPLHFVRRVPVESFGFTSAGLFALTFLVGASVGALVFARRDLTV